MTLIANCSYKAFTIVLVQHLFTAYDVSRTWLVTQAQQTYKKNTRQPVSFKKSANPFNHEKLNYFLRSFLSIGDPAEGPQRRKSETKADWTRRGGLVGEVVFK